ncbi:YeeE/YedE family protein [Psychromonas sp. MME2]|uniref:YeeE/YedE family protein n=1 Tax=unclassified Psychromonas TaxID=2614957 RepID=UPI00339BDC19
MPISTRSSVKTVRILAALIAGLLFGCGMIVSGMVDPHNVIAFLNITGNWDPSLAFVMGGALAVFTPCYHFIIKKRCVAVNGDKFSWMSNTKVDGTLLSGAMFFGIGWGVAGICPGPAMASIGNYIILYFILSMVVGMVLANLYLSGRVPLPIVGYRNNVCAVKSN